MYDPVREADELRDQLASDRRRMAFLFGAGTSQAVGLPGIAGLTDQVRNYLGAAEKTAYDRLLAEAGAGATVEHVLDRVRLCRELIGSSPVYEAGGLKGTAAAVLDRAICRAIFTVVSATPPGGIEPHTRFANWLRVVRREWPAEIFTTNYDVLIELGLERAETPHFDGFVGSVSPYFSNATVDADTHRTYEMYYPPRSWVRVWKLHGSIGWRLTKDPTTGTLRIIRVSGLPPGTDDDLLIFPSRQKYSDSRKLPFVAYHDRLRKLLSSGEILLVVCGYSFSDEHINELLYEALRNNSRLAVAALIHGTFKSSTAIERAVTISHSLRNLSIYGPDQACIAGMQGPWVDPSKPPVPPLTAWPFWDSASKRFTLGDFAVFTEFLTRFFAPTPTPIAPGTGSASAASSSV
jgi:hypothetical protein